MQDVLRLQARVLDSMAEGVSVLPLDSGLISYTNPAQDRMFGCRPGGLIGKHLRDLHAHAPEENQRIVSAVIEQLREKGEWSGELFNRRNDGSAFYSYARITTVELDGRKYAVCVQEDTTRRRFEALDELLPALAGVLDIREVFERVSDIARQVIPHDSLSLPLVSEDRNHLVVYAVTGYTSRIPEAVPLPDHHRPLLTAPWEHLIQADIQEDPLERLTPPAQAGYRARLCVPVRIHGEFLGALDFLSMQPGIYSVGDALVARRIADHVALELSHQRLAEEARRNEELRAREARLATRVKSLAAELNAVTGYRLVIGQSDPWTRVLKQATQVAGTETTVLLLGESGTGKEVIARFIHRASARSGGPFVALNCAALPEPLLESELFGFERGAFTGAMQAKPGQIEQAAGGLLFLDEVGDMSPSAQAKFLRVLQEREFQRLGATRSLKANVRVVAATNRNLRTAIERGTFREDLFYRLHVFAIQLPSLRERRDDILPLSEAFLTEIAKALGRPPAGISREARKALLDYDWPGNVRELRNMLERAAILCEGGLITGDHLTFVASERPREPARKAESVPASAAAVDTTDLRILERAAIERALQESRQNKSHAAKMLGLSRKQLYVRLRQHGIN
jgi:PAS domain S-box-containing protein